MITHPDKFNVKNFAQLHIWENRRTYDAKLNREDYMSIFVEVVDDKDRRIQLWEIEFVKGYDIMNNPKWNWANTKQIERSPMKIIK